MRILDLGCEGVISGVISGVRGYYIRGMRVLDPRYEGIRSGYEGIRSRV